MLCAMGFRCSAGFALLILLKCYQVSSFQYSFSVNASANPVLSFVDGTSTFQQSFNPSWVTSGSASSRTDSVPIGLLVRSQNCSATIGGDCPHCGGTGANASVISFAQYLGSDNGQPHFSVPDSSSVVFGPHDLSDEMGTEDPRLLYVASVDQYFMFYTAYGKQPNGKDNSVLLSLATTHDPTISTGWQRHGAVFPTIQGSKSAALLPSSSPSTPHYLFWGDTSIKVAKSANLFNWTNTGEVLLAPRPGGFDSLLVEAGPPPLKLSSGDYVFFYNSANKDGYHAAYAILDAQNATHVVQRSPLNEPLLSPTTAWERGVSPYTCNVANVVFLQAAEVVERLAGDTTTDIFRVYFGGADAVIGTALIAITTSGDAHDFLVERT